MAHTKRAPATSTASTRAARPKIPHADLIAIRYGSAGLALAKEIHKVGPTFAGVPIYTLDYGMTASRRRQARESMHTVIQRLLADKIMAGELMDGRAHVRIAGWHPERIPRHPALKPRPGDCGTLKGRSRTVVRVEMGFVVVTNGASEKEQRIKEGSWRSFAKKASFTVKAP